MNDITDPYHTWVSKAMRETHEDPSVSWWIEAKREGFTQRSAQELARMNRTAKPGRQTATPTSEAS